MSKMNFTISIRKSSSNYYRFNCFRQNILDITSRIFFIDTLKINIIIITKHDVIVLLNFGNKMILGSFLFFLKINLILAINNLGGRFKHFFIDFYGFLSELYRI